MSDTQSPPRPTIRRATSDDYDGITEVWSKARLPISASGRDRRKAFLHQLERFPSTYLVAVDGLRIVGVVLGSHDHRKGWINRLAVHPDYCGRGTASALVRACERALHAEGIDIIAALVGPDNKDSCALFEKLGYLTDVPVRYYRKLSHSEA